MFMAVVDLIFDWAKQIITTFSSVSEWFVTPLYTTHEYSKIEAWGLQRLAELNGKEFVNSVVEVSPASIVMGSFLSVYLTLLVMSWVKKLL